MMETGGQVNNVDKYVLYSYQFAKQLTKFCFNQSKYLHLALIRSWRKSSQIKQGKHVF